MKILSLVVAFLAISPPALAEPPKIPVATSSGLVKFMTLEEYKEYVKPMGHLPVPSPILIFGPRGTPLNAGHIMPPAVSNYGLPHPGQSSMTMRNDGGYHHQSCVPPSYQPPSAIAGAVYGGTPHVKDKRGESGRSEVGRTRKVVAPTTLA